MSQCHHSVNTTGCTTNVTTVPYHSGYLSPYHDTVTINFNKSSSSSEIYNNNGLLRTRDDANGDDDDEDDDDDDAGDDVFFD